MDVCTLYGLMLIHNGTVAGVTGLAGNTTSRNCIKCHQFVMGQFGLQEQQGQKTAQLRDRFEHWQQVFPRPVWLNGFDFDSVAS